MFIYHDGENPTSRRLGEPILRNNALLKDNGIRDGSDLYGVRHCKGAASVLIAAGFITNSAAFDLLIARGEAIGRRIGRAVFEHRGLRSKVQAWPGGLPHQAPTISLAISFRGAS